jgi:hypothetical protein
MSRTLSQGMTGQDVRALQDALNFHIPWGEALKVDGIFLFRDLTRFVDANIAERVGSRIGRQAGKR